MFEETKEMIDSTIYTNGRGEVTAQNVNLAMHGMLDAVEGKFEEVDGEIASTEEKITEIKNDIIKLGESGLGGLCFKFPLLLCDFLEINDPEEMFLADETIQPIIAEYPQLAQPIEEIMENNNKMLQKVIDALNEGKPMPVITIDYNALVDELSELMGEDVSIYISAASIIPTTSYVLQNSYLYCYAEMYGERIGLVFASGISGVTEYSGAYSVYIPTPTGNPHDNSVALYSLRDVNVDSMYALSLCYKYQIDSSSTYQSIIPVHAKKSELGQNMLIRFVVDTDILEATVNLETGLTRSRIIAKMTPEEVGIIPEGTLERIHNLTYPYYEILPAEGGAVVSLGIKANVDWMLYDHDRLLKSGVAGSTTYEYAVGQNLSTEIYNHNYRLVAASDEEELATLWVTQQAAVSTVNEE